MDKYLGKRLDGRYEIEEIIGVGGMAVVYKAYDNVEDRTVAVKILKEEFALNDEFVRRFKNESKAIAILSHQNIVKVYDVSFGDLIQYIVMEYIDGITLKEYIERQGSLLWKDTVYFTIQILKALQHAHDKGIVHRDVKPQNIMVLKDGTIKVTDFGIARFARNEQRTITDKAIGSVHYISPEQARGEKTDEKADLYSVGVMLYEMLTGQLPFEADSAVSVAIMQLQRDPKPPTEINSSIPLGLEQVTMKAMQKNSDRRYQSAAEMLCDLEAFKKDPAITFEHTYFVDNEPTKYVEAGETPVPVKPEKPAPTQKEKNKTIPILAGVASAFVVVLVVLGIIFLPRLFSNTGEEFKCPQFVGRTKDEIINSEDSKNLVISWVEDANENYEQGVVFEQSQPNGKKLKKGAKITLKVSSGAELVMVPDVYKKSETLAFETIKDANLKPVVQKISDDEIEAGLVIKTDPERGKNVAKNSEVIIYISSGKEAVEVPSVVGLSASQAKSDIESKGLVASVVTRALKADEKSYPEGDVIEQSPAAGEKLPDGSTVTIYVSSGVYNYELSVSGLASQYGDSSSGRIVIYSGGVELAGKKVELGDLPGGKCDGFKFTHEKSSISVVVRFIDDSGNKTDLKSCEIKASTTDINAGG